MTLSQIISLLIPIAILDSVNPSAIVLTLTMLISGIDSKKVMAYIMGIFLIYFSIGLLVVYLFEYSGITFKFDFGFVGDYINSPPIWAILVQLIVGILILYNCINNRIKPKVVEFKKPKLTQNSIFSYFILGVIITGVESTSALPYFGAFSSLFLANLGFDTNVFLLFGYCIIFVLPPISLVVIRTLYKEDFDKIINRIKLFSSKYSPKILFYFPLVLSIFIISDALVNLIM
jgi:hypothetical protein